MEPSPPATSAASGDRDLPEDALSVRAAAEWMDRENPPRRLRGNGPPFAPDRFDASGDRKEGAWEKAGYDGQNTVKRPGTMADVAYDMGMAYRTDKSHAVPSLTPKGLVECHRWREGGDDWRSLRSSLMRHEQGVRVRCLWLNAVLWEGADNQFERAREIGSVIGEGQYDVVALCEIRDDALVDALVDHYRLAGRRTLMDTRGPRFEKSVSKQTYTTHKLDEQTDGDDDPVPDVDNGSGLVTLIGTEGSDPDPGWRVADRNVERYPKEVNGTITWAPFKIFTRGYHRHTIDLTDADGLRGFDLFSTHLEGNQKPETQEKKQAQLEALTNAIAEFQRTEERGDRPGVPKIAVGDLNFKSDGSGYGNGDSDVDELVSKFSDVGLDDAWLTHGGPTGDTVGTDVGRTLTSGEPFPGGAASPQRTCYCDEFDGLSKAPDKQVRLDYVFVEQPKARHDVTIDVSRMWRVPFSTDCPGVSGPPPKSKFSDRLVDHVGIGFELLVTPN